MALCCQKQNVDQQLCQEVHWPYASQKDAPAPYSKVQPFLRFASPLRASKTAVLALTVLPLPWMYLYPTLSYGFLFDIL